MIKKFNYYLSTMQPVKGALAILIVFSIAMVSYASDHSPTTTKADVSVLISSATNYHDCDNGGGSNVNTVAILPTFFVIEDVPSYVMQWTIGTPTKQADEHFLCLRSLNELTYNRMRNSK